MLRVKTLSVGYAVYVRNDSEGREVVERLLRKGLAHDIRPLQFKIRVTSGDPALVTYALEILEEWQQEQFRLDCEYLYRKAYAYEEREGSASGDEPDVYDEIESPFGRKDNVVLLRN